MAEQKKIDYDGTDVLSTVLKELLNEFPGVNTEIAFSTLSETSGIAIFPTSGAAIISEKESITGHVRQVCTYPFTVVYRASLKKEGQKLKVKESLDTLARWLERQPVTLDGETFQLDKYPDMASGNRRIKAISRTSSAHLNAVYQDGVEDWLISMSLKYENEFDR